METRELRVELSAKDHLVISVLNHLSRDVIGLTTKLIAAAKLVERISSEEDLATASSPVTSGLLPPSLLPPSLLPPSSPVKKMNSARDLLQIGELTKLNRELQAERQQLEKRAAAEKNEKEEAVAKLREAEERLTSINNNYFAIEQELKGLREEKAKWEHHQTYLENEIKIARSEGQHLAGELQTKGAELAHLAERVGRFEQQQQRKPYEQLEKEYEQGLVENQRLNSANTFLAAEKERLEDLSRGSASRIEQLSEEITYLEKKHALLASQKMEQLKSADHSQALRAFEDRERLRERELLKLQDQVRELIEENNLLRIHSPKADKLDKKPKKSQLLEVQKVANRLAEAITEKDLVNEQLRGVNKQLIEKVAALERRLLELEEERHRPAAQ